MPLAACLLSAALSTSSLQASTELGSCERKADGARMVFSVSEDGQYFEHGYEGASFNELTPLQSVAFKKFPFKDGYDIVLNTINFEGGKRELIKINNETGDGKIFYTDVHIEDCWPGTNEWCIVKIPLPRISRLTVEFENCSFETL